MKQLLEKPILTEGRYSAYINYDGDVLPTVVVCYEEETSPFKDAGIFYALSDALLAKGYLVSTLPYGDGKLFGMNGDLLVTPKGEVVSL